MDQDDTEEAAEGHAINKQGALRKNSCMTSDRKRKNISMGAITLRASLSGTFLQTLPDLVTPLKGHSLSRAAVQRRGQRPPKGSGTNMTVEAT